MLHYCITPIFEGFLTSAGLIMVIGAQNAFVLKQGIMKNHVFVTVLLCALIDALLITLGVGGFGHILVSNALLLNMARWGGVIFLAYYGLRSFLAVFKTESLTVSANSIDRPNFKQSIFTVLALSLLNPHVYLDTVILLGSISAQFPIKEQPFFAVGAITASFIWFFSMGFGARYLGPLFQKPISWKILDFIVGCVMWLIALMLIFNLESMVCHTS
jgi:L-lysine exporter family protein LysE/ArgO